MLIFCMNNPDTKNNMKTILCTSLNDYVRVGGQTSWVLSALPKKFNGPPLLILNSYINTIIMQNLVLVSQFERLV